MGLRVWGQGLTILNLKVDEDSLLKRTAYLKQQRDRLLAMKKAEREKQLADAEATQARSRPKVCN